MEKKQQHTSELGSDEDLAIEVAYNTRLVHGRHGRHTETLKRTFINGATWMRERLLKRIEANEQRIASLTEQVEQRWISVDERLPDIDDSGYSKDVLVLISNPYWKNSPMYTASVHRTKIGDMPPIYFWQGIEANVLHHGDNRPKVTHWQPLPPIPNNSPTVTK